MHIEADHVHSAHAAPFAAERRVQRLRADPPPLNIGLPDGDSAKPKETELPEQENDDFTIASIRVLTDGKFVVPINFRVGTPPDHTFVEVNTVLPADETATIAELRARALDKAASTISALHERLHRERHQ